MYKARSKSLRNQFLTLFFTFTAQLHYCRSHALLSVVEGLMGLKVCAGVLTLLQEYTN